MVSKREGGIKFQACEGTLARLRSNAVVGHFYVVTYKLKVLCVFSGEGSQPSGTSEDTTLSSMARAVQVHPDANNVMYFA